MTLKIYNPTSFNLGDFLNCLPVISGLAKSLNDTVRLVVPDDMRKFNGFREFMEFQPCIEELVFRGEIINMDEPSYLYVTYCENEFKELKERPVRPIETMRHETFVRTYYPALKWKVDDEFRLLYDAPYMGTTSTYFIGDRWSSVRDTRRSCNILKESGIFDDEEKFIFLDYEKPLLENCWLIDMPGKHFITGVTGTSVLADLLGKETIVVYNDEFLNWNDMPVEYTEWKHFYPDRGVKMYHISDPFLKTL